MLTALHYCCPATLPALDAPFALVQIHDDGAPLLPVPALASQVLQLGFDDIHDHSPGLLPPDVAHLLANDAARVEQATAPGQRRLVRLCGLQHAQALAHFARSLRLQPRSQILVVQSQGNVARARAVAQVLAAWSGLAAQGADQATPPNPRVQRLLQLVLPASAVATAEAAALG